MRTEEYDVIIVGAGAVGLFLAIRLDQLGLRTLLIEKRSGIHHHSRSIGIHPPSLERFGQMGLIDRFLQKGVRVQFGHAYRFNRRLGSISLQRSPGAYPFIMTLRQFETEQILEDRVRSGTNIVFMRELDISELVAEPDGVRLEAKSRTGESISMRGRYLVGCDGKHSFVRNIAGIPWEGATYPDTFVMGDFTDKTAWANEARIFFRDRGFIESFPMPGGLRRWVVSTDTFQNMPHESDFCVTVSKWTNQYLLGTLAGPLSAFHVHHYLAKTFVKGRILLAGDAAHVMSPIGGQGMNIGWLDAWDIATALHNTLKQGKKPEKELRDFSRRARRRAARAIQRAASYMAVGNSSHPRCRDGFVRALLAKPFQSITARLFTMRWL